MCTQIRLAAMCLILSVAFASAQQAGVTTGPASGTNIEPSTAIQKDASGRSATEAGAPGVEAKPGSEGGRSPEKSDQSKMK
ncbi:hypothetical protein [Methylocapsa palsarum]|uniref:Uncharacterized protein n=1 Tax=Methylocapsa palsarum TaxID=1612308 RepID=A0A1I4CF70_9HYPH|nr:hypothetical protein [Methylocapsa palsarum]SFK78947.1 hypothetical protein SAMN05444581_1215 [Methylocapsa palsarum]